MTAQNSSLVRRLAAILYDSLLLFALMALVTIPFIAMHGGEFVEPESPPHQMALFIVIYAFFVGFWSRKGRTLGMQSWGLQLQTMDGKIPAMSTASLRFFAAILSWIPFGLGFIWQLWDKDKLTWHDRLSGTRLVHYPKV